MNITKFIIFSTKNKKEPFSDWLIKLDPHTRSVIRSRIDRVRLGILGDVKRLKGCDGLWEIRINYGAGYRVYFGKKGSTIIVILLGGDKGSQSRDILKAKKYWLECKDLFDE